MDAQRLTTLRAAHHHLTVLLWLLRTQRADAATAATNYINRMDGAVVFMQLHERRTARRWAALKEFFYQEDEWGSVVRGSQPTQVERMLEEMLAVLERETRGLE